MKTRLVLLLLLGMFISFSCCNTSNKTNSKTVKAEEKIYHPPVIKPDTTIYIVLNDSMREVLTTQGKLISIRAKKAIKNALQNAIKDGGLEYALEYCNVNAMPITDSVSMNEHVQIRRLAKKYRNPLNETDENESNIYKSYVIKWINGQYMYPMVIPGKNNHPVYFDPMLVEALCLNCHGTPGEQINPELSKKIAELYPNDKAIDFKAGELRGMWSITFLDYIITDVK
ncbi:MAG TPA: DUF3365 domain-containing protein [Bacteroidales bacterium]